MRVGLDVSVLNDQNLSGVGVYTEGLIKELLDRDQENHYQLFGFSSSDTLKNKFPNQSLKTVVIPTKAFRTAFLLWQKLNFPPIDSFIGKVDIFHSFNWYFPPQKFGKKVATVFDLTPLLFPELHHQDTVQLEKIRLKRIGKYADLVITISENSKKDFLKFFPKSRVEVIYPGFSKTSFKNNKSKILQKHNLKSGYFLSVATIEPRKNISSLIKAYNQGNFDRPLVLVGGEGWKNTEIKKWAQENPKIFLTGFVEDEDLEVLYKNALCLVYPSIYEGFGLPVLEALNFKTPVITSNVSSLPEVGGKAVLYINPQKINEITKAMKRIETDEALRKKMVTLGLTQAKKFNWEISVKKLLGLYDDLVSNTAGVSKTQSKIG